VLWLHDRRRHTNPFVILLIAIASEIVGTNALRLSSGFTKLLPSLLVIVCYGLSFYLFALALKQIPLGIAYAIWAGLGTAGVALIGVLVWREPLNWWQVLGIVLIVVGVIVLNAFTKNQG
jgi:small multidrug resistance pump